MENAKTVELVVEGWVALPESEVTPGRDRARRRIRISCESGLILAVDDAPPAEEDVAAAPREPHGSPLILSAEHTLLPGIIDLHVHAREDTTATHAYKETFRSAGEAAIHGGVTAFAEMPNNPVPPVDDTSYLAKRELATRSCAVDVLLYAGLGPRTQPLSFKVPYKAYMGQSVGELFFEDDATLLEALRRYPGQLVAFHAESPTVLARCRDQPTHVERRPPEAELEAVETAIRFAEEVGIEAHICHLSTAGGLDRIRAARERGLAITCEVTPQHLYYDYDNCEHYQDPGFLQCNPPIRTPADRRGLLEGFLAGDIDYLATDHAPHSLDENRTGISGMPHLDTYGPFLFWLREQGASWARLLEASSRGPGKFLSRFLPDRYGTIEAGAVGSLTVLQERQHAVRRDELRTRAGWSPFEGHTFLGRVSHTIVRGRVYRLEA